MENKETRKEADSKWTVNQAQEFALSKFKNKSDFKEGIVSWESILDVLKIGVLTGYKFGAKWQEEQNKNLYSEEDLKKAYKDGGRNEYDFINKYHCKARISFDEWFEQFKKK